MDKLNPKQSEAIKKLSTVRLVSKLTQAGIKEETLEPLGREQLMEAWAELIAAGKDVPLAPVTATAAATSSADIEREKLLFERERFQADMAAREADRDERRSAQQQESARLQAAQEQEAARLAWERSRVEQEQEERRRAQEQEAARFQATQEQESARFQLAQEQEAARAQAAQEERRLDREAELHRLETEKEERQSAREEEAARALQQLKLLEEANKLQRQ